VQGAVTFEKTPYYLASTVAAVEMHAWLPSLKVVALLRDPSARAYSSFYHHCDRNGRLVLRPDDKSPGMGKAPSGDGSSGSGSRVVFNQDCGRVEHCCCGPYDLAPPHGGSQAQRQRVASRGGVVGGAVAGALSRAGLAASLGPASADPSKGLKRATCDAASFERYLASTVMDPASPMLGTVLRKVRSAPLPCSAALRQTGPSSRLSVELAAGSLCTWLWWGSRLCAAGPLC
jgi:hypothetical protein